MKQSRGHRSFLAGLFVMAGFGCFVLSTPEPASWQPTRTQLRNRVRPVQHLGSLPMRFEKNQGQSAARFDFVARGKNYELLLSDGGFDLSLRNGATASPDTLTMRLGKARRSKAVGIGELPGQVHYFAGETEEEWITGIPTYEKVGFDAVYPDVDLIYYGRGPELEYDFVVKPGAHPEIIELEFEGAEATFVDERGDLVLALAGGEVRQSRPKGYQQIGEDTREIPVRYRLMASNRVGFDVSAYDLALPLTIDPPLSYSTYLGGSSDETGNSVAVDSSGSVYLTGKTASSGFPTTSGAVQPGRSGSDDVFITKLNPAGTGVVFSTFLGGSDEDIATGIAIDSSGNVYIAGETRSSNFPVRGAIQSARSGQTDCFVAKLGPGGNTLFYSTYFGDDENDRCTGIAVDPARSAHVSGVTRSENFPVTPGAFQTEFGLGEGGDEDGFVTKFNAAGTQVIYSTFLGGGGDDGAEAITADLQGNTYVTGYTRSDKFPVTPGAQQPQRDSDRDAFVSKLSSDGRRLLYGTFLGGDSDDTGRAMTLDASGAIYVAGITRSNDFPVSVDAFQRLFLGTTDAFVTKYDPQGRGVYSTYLGGLAGDGAFGLAVDRGGNATVVGVTRSIFFPVTNDALQLDFGGGATDGFVATLNAAGTGLVESTFLGGRSEDEAKAIAIDATGNLFVTGFTESNNFWVSNDAFQPSRQGDADAFVSRFGFGIATTVSAASFAGTVAPDSLASLFGQGWAESNFPATPGAPLPFELGGVRVTLTDSAGTEFPAPLVLVSPLQINFLVPDRMAAGQATVIVTRGGGTIATGTLEIAAVSPGLFSANADGQGVAAATILRRTASGDTQEFVFSFDPIGQRMPAPIDLGPPSDQVFLSLFGTGIRGGSEVSVTFNGIPSEPLFFGPQAQFEGLDQINVPLSRDLIGSGVVNVLLVVDGQLSNPLTIRVQ